MIIKKKKTQNTQISKKADMSQSSDLKPQEEAKQTEEIDLFNLDNIDFKQRSERRRGDRRRGFRRVDDRNLISRAREEAEAIRESAAKEGYREGLEKAKADIEEFKSALTSFVNSKQEVFEKIMPEILGMSLDIAKKIIKNEITQSPEMLLGTVREILKGLSKDETKITIRTNPSQVNMLKTEIPEQASGLGLDAKITVIPDETIMEGGCVVSTTNGVVDATIETQLAIISEALKEV